MVEHLLLAQVKEDLSDPAIVEHQGRLRELEREIDNMVSAIASGALRGSPALAARLAAAESELSRLKEPVQDRAPIERLIPRIGERYLHMVGELEKTAERDPLRARQALFEALQEPITLHPENGVLVAEIGYRAPLPLVGNVSENMVGGPDLGIECHPSPQDSAT